LLMSGAHYRNVQAAGEAGMRSASKERPRLPAALSWPGLWSAVRTAASGAAPLQRAIGRAQATQQPVSVAGLLASPRMVPWRRRAFHTEHFPLAALLAGGRRREQLRTWRRPTKMTIFRHISREQSASHSCRRPPVSRPQDSSHVSRPIYDIQYYFCNAPAEHGPPRPPHGVVDEFAASVPAGCSPPRVFGGQLEGPCAPRMPQTSAGRTVVLDCNGADAPAVPIRPAAAPPLGAG
jgi:hypothetical protein